MFPILYLSIVTLLFCNGVSSQNLEAKSDCIERSELEDLKFQINSKMSESEKELDSLRSDLHYWQNTTLSILKNYLAEKEEGVCSFGTDEAANSLRSFISDQVEKCCNETRKYFNQKILGTMMEHLHNQSREVVEQMREQSRELEELKSQQIDELHQHRIAQSRELQEIISETSSDSLPLGTFLNPAPSCKQVNGSQSGNYWIQNAGTGYASLQYCDMTERCGKTGGWMRVAFLDMSNQRHHCPAGFRTQSGPGRSCDAPRPSCTSVTYSVEGVAYSRVCGRIKAYQYGSPDAFGPYYNNRALKLDDEYVDGISLTHGKNPRRHIWTFACGVDEVEEMSTHACPCAGSNFRGVVPPFIGQDYFCDTGSKYGWALQWFTYDPLWDGDGCRGTSTSCCQFNNPPWFCKDLPETTTDDIELRLCFDEDISNENVGIEDIEIYTQ